MNKFTPLMAAVLMAGSSAGAWAATDLQKCGVLTGKTIATLYTAIGKEGAKLCAQGSAQNALEAKLTPAAKAAGSAILRISRSIDKYGAENCLGEPFEPVDVVADLTQDLADMACSAAP